MSQPGKIPETKYVRPENLYPIEKGMGALFILVAVLLYVLVFNDEGVQAEFLQDPKLKYYLMFIVFMIFIIGILWLVGVFHNYPGVEDPDRST
jgi:hypothetical protein